MINVLEATSDLSQSLTLPVSPMYVHCPRIRSIGRTSVFYPHFHFISGAISKLLQTKSRQNKEIVCTRINPCALSSGRTIQWTPCTRLDLFILYLGMRIYLWTMEQGARRGDLFFVSLATKQLSCLLKSWVTPFKPRQGLSQLFGARNRKNRCGVREAWGWKGVLEWCREHR